MSFSYSKLAIRSLLLLTIPFLIVTATVLALSQIKADTQQNILKSLRAVNQTTQETLHVWLWFRKAGLVQISRDEKLIALSKKLINLQKKRAEILSSETLVKLRSFMNKKMEPHSDIGFFVINRHRLNIASMRDENIGYLNLIHQQRQDYLDRVFDGETLFIPTITSDVPLKTKSGIYKENLPTIFIATPIYDKSNNVIAALTIRLDPSRDFSRMIQLGRIGDSGETYAFDDKGILISKSRFHSQLQRIGLIADNDPTSLSLRISDPGGNLIKGFTPSLPNEERPLTVMAKSALSKVSSYNIKGYRDYRGVNVLGAWLWNESLQIGIATEIDANEAMLPYYNTRLTIILVLLLIVLLFIGVLIMEHKSKKKLQNAYAQSENNVLERTKELENLNLELEQLSLLDGLTGIANRRMFDQSLIHEWDLSQRSQKPLSLILLDIDFFKEYNDTYGHLQGDYCLKHIARTLSSTLKRSVDLICRYGGEEFVILLPDTNEKQAAQLAEMFRLKIIEQQIPHESSTICNIVTISLGVSTMTASPDTAPALLINSADKLLYLAKNNGRNRIETP